MHVVGIKILHKFKAKHRDVSDQLDLWLYEVEEAHWKTPNELKARFPKASILSNNRVVFDIKGNEYRLLTKIEYNNQLVLIIKIDIHAKYTRWQL